MLSLDAVMVQAPGSGNPKAEVRNPNEARSPMPEAASAFAEAAGVRPSPPLPSNSHYGPVTPRRVRAPGLHPPQNRHLVGRVPSPGVPISSIMRIGDARTQRRFMPLLRSLAELVAGGLRRQEGR